MKKKKKKKKQDRVVGTLAKFQDFEVVELQNHAIGQPLVTIVVERNTTSFLGWWHLAGEGESSGVGRVSITRPSDLDISDSD